MRIVSESGRGTTVTLVFPRAVTAGPAEPAAAGARAIPQLEQPAAAHR
jgi:hypothetical protein